MVKWLTIYWRTQGSYCNEKQFQTMSAVTFSNIKPQGNGIFSRVCPSELYEPSHYNYFNHFSVFTAEIFTLIEDQNGKNPYPISEQITALSYLWERTNMYGLYREQGTLQFMGSVARKISSKVSLHFTTTVLNLIVDITFVLSILFHLLNYSYSHRL